MHVRPGIIRSIFEYFVRMAPSWSEFLKLFGITFDEMYLDPACDIDRLLDMPINPNHHKNAQIITCRQICGPGKWPFFVDTNYAIPPDDLINFVMDFDACGITVLSFTCDQGRIFLVMAKIIEICVLFVCVRYLQFRISFSFFFFKKLIRTRGKSLLEL